MYKQSQQKLAVRVKIKIKTSKNFTHIGLAPMFMHYFTAIVDDFCSDSIVILTRSGHSE
jgi:hypothetical protein